MTRTVNATDDQRPLVWPAKDANDVLDYSIDFGARIGADTISTATFSLATAAGLTLGDDDTTDTTATITISGGTEGSKGKVLCRITTADGQTMDATVSLPVRAR
jgi:hypothetical protein